MSPSFENPRQEPASEQRENSESPKENKHTPRRLVAACKANVMPLVGEIAMTGEDHIAELGPDEKVVIATTHISDLDIPLAIIELADHFNIAVSDESTNHEFFTDPGANFGIRLAGQDNFLPIDYKKDKAGKTARFNADNFAPMAEALGNGKSVLVAAHNPSKQGHLESGGIGAVYLAQIADAAILPVAANVAGESFYAGQNPLKMMRERPKVEVIIGKPIRLPHIDGIERYGEILNIRKERKLTHEEVAEFHSLTEKLREQSDLVMQTLAALVPNEKRGPYAVEDEPPLHTDM